MMELIIQSGKHQGKRLHLPDDGEVLIGRDEDCQVRLASSDVSRHHCVLKASPEGILARDLDSRNGTYLNDTLMEQETLLKPGDVLRIGPIALQVPGAPIRSSSASDADIASWLSAEAMGSDTATAGSPGDTTIIPRLAPIESPAPAQTPVPREPKKEFRNLAEEAADIIRRHWQSLKDQSEE